MFRSIIIVEKIEYNERNVCIHCPKYNRKNIKNWKN